MTDLRVDPQNLTDTAARLADRSRELQALTAEIHRTASDAPSYDGQFGPKVRGLANEGASQLGSQAKSLDDLAQQLAVIGQEFERVDSQSISGMSRLGTLLQGIAEFLGLAPDGLYTVSGLTDLTATPIPTPEPVLTPGPPISATPVAAAELSTTPALSGFYWSGYTEQALADYQQYQGARNDCAEFSVAAALNLMVGTNYQGADLGRTADENAFIIPFFGQRMFPDGPTTPWQAANIVNGLAVQDGIAVSARTVHANTDELAEYVRQPDVIPIVVVAWGEDDPPAIARDGEIPPRLSADPLGAHAMVLVAHDPLHSDPARGSTPWGLVNSWTDGGDDIYWMSDDDLERTLNHPILALANTVIIEDLSGLDPELAGPVAVAQPVPTPTPIPTATPTPPDK
jgi:uncharacterized protein YukE